MTAITITFQGSGLPKFEDAVAALGSTKATRAYRMALNTTGKKVYTEVKRTVAKQMGATQARVVKYGHLRRMPALGSNLQTSIESSGGYIPLKDFSGRQTRKGVSASPWGKRRLFGSTFIVAKLGGQVFRNTGKFSEKSGRNNAIESLWGPAVPKELVKDQSKAAFERIATQTLPSEAARLIKLLTSGAMT
ncbi:hypothetical protein [Devosia sp. 1635]|uniref:hypothetical protein n=1 Tax=Devosia sp. 1635 TaxID=2726066 RepID=UPI00156793D6|nr:hypothetical protein [Devosia sp. 1635]